MQKKINYNITPWYKFHNNENFVLESDNKWYHIPDFKIQGNTIIL